MRFCLTSPIFMTEKNIGLNSEDIKKSPLNRTFQRKNAPDGIRTHDQRLRKPLLYPAELQVHYQSIIYHKMVVVKKNFHI